MLFKRPSTNILIVGRGFLYYTYHNIHIKSSRVDYLRGKDNMYRLGIDIGSVSINAAILNENGTIIKSHYIRHKGKPFFVAKEAIEQAINEYEIEFIATTGTGAKAFASLIGAPFINEIVAISRAMGHLYPATGSVIDIGGEDSKLIVFEHTGKKNAPLRVKDFSMNALCAAGTGSFLDQQASRLRFTIEEFSEVALKAANIPRIAGRCTVFAKSDMIHLQQIATPDFEIVAGLCYALARNFKGNISKGKELKNPRRFYWWSGRKFRDEKGDQRRL